MKLAFDPGDKTGYAVLDKNKIIETGIIKYKTEMDYFHKIKNLYDNLLPDFVVVEQPFAGKFAKAVISLAKKVAIITLACKSRIEEALVVEIPPSEWKKKIGLKGNAKKEEIQEKIKELFDKELTEHEADAVGLALSVEV